MARFIDELKRTHHCGELRATDEGKEVVLFGWVASYRDHGGCVFIDLRDREGITQLVFDPELQGHGERAEGGVRRSRSALRSEWVIGVRGVVKSRGREQEPEARRPARSRSAAVELTRLQQERDAALRDRRRDRHRRGEAPAVPLPRSCAAPRSRRRSASATASTRTTRRYFDEQGFLELETPVMVKYTPGGARNFLVPSPHEPGQVLRAGREPAALQAALHGGGLRPVLPDRQVLPRRGPAPRPPARVHADRRRDVAS